MAPPIQTRKAKPGSVNTDSAGTLMAKTATYAAAIDAIAHAGCTVLPDPVSDEEIGIGLDRGMAIRGPDELLAVGREHREAVEGGAERHLLEARAVEVDEVEIEVRAARVL